MGGFNKLAALLDEMLLVLRHCLYRVRYVMDRIQEML